jgi:hypothetical protein
MQPMSEPPAEETTAKRTGGRAWRRLCFLGAAAILLVATPLSLSQDPAPDPLHPPEIFSPAWWWLPIELHAGDRLPWVDADLLDVAAVADVAGTHVVAVGRKGTIIASDDGGRTWRSEPARARPPAADDVTETPGLRDYGAPTPAGGSDPANNPANPPAPAPPRRDQKSPKDKEPETKPPKAAALLEWLVPSAHAVQGQEENAPAEPQRHVPELELQPATDDLVALVLESWPGGASALSASGSSFARKGDAWISLAAGSASPTVLAMARRPALRLLSTGDIVPPGTSSLRPALPRLPLARSVRSTDDGRIVACAGDRVYRLNRNAWLPLGQPAPLPLRGLHFHDATHGWAVGGGLVFRTQDGGQRWQASETRAPVALNALFFLPGGQRGWIAGNDGYVAETGDGGATFLSRTRPRLARAGDAGTPVRLPPPWYALAWLAALGLFFVGRSIPASKEGETELAVAPAFASDRPLERGDPDVLNLSGLAAGLSRFLRNDATRPPLTIAVTGIWGTGKSSLMNLLRADLRTFGFHPVWFNAWHHQSEEYLLASLLQSIRLQAIPSWWRIEGLLFRVHLLLLRGRKHALLLLALLAATGLLIASESASGRVPDMAGTWKLVRAWITFFIDPTQKEPTGTFEGLYLAKIGTLLALGVSVLRGLRAFGLNPGTLLAGAAGSIRMRDLDARTSFRERFRAEYAEVTQALGPRKLIIFIDDLDRCQPAQVMQVLESVNFLVTSGECFVILGMDRDRVVPCVALTFKDIAAELSRGDDDADARQAYANQYLDKLINIEVPIPALNAADAETLLAPETPPEPPQAPVRWLGLGRGLRELVELLRPGFRLWPLVLAAAVVLGAYAGGKMMWKGTAAVVAQAESPGGKADQPSPAPTEKALTGGVAAEQSAVALAIADEIARRSVQTGRFVPPGGGGSFPVGVLVVGLLAAWMLFLLIQIAQLRPETVVRDSSEFSGALRAWRTLIFKSAATPRALRRFQNRVRFLSMRQRRAADERPWWRRATDLVRRAPEVKAELEADPIPERTLVALAAIYQTQPELLEKPLTTEQARAITPTPPANLTDPAALARSPWNAEALAAEVARHREQFLYRVRGFRVR